MIVGLGTDIVDIRRIAATLDRFGARFTLNPPAVRTASIRPSHRSRRFQSNKIEHPSGSGGSLLSPRARMIAHRAASRLYRSSHARA